METGGKLTYAGVEGILGGMFAVPDADALRGVFRARLIHLGRLGLPLGVDRPGKGRRISYTADHVRQMALALELEEFGVDPTLIRNLLHDQWTSRLRACFGNTRNRPWLMLPVHMMSAGWLDGVDASRFGHVLTWKPGEEIPDRRVIMINLVKLEAAIDEGVAAVLAAWKPAKTKKGASDASQG